MKNDTSLFSLRNIKILTNMQKKFFEFLVQAALTVGLFWTILKLTPKSALLSFTILQLRSNSRAKFTDSELMSLLSHYLRYSIVKDSSVDLGVNFKIAQIRPTVKAVSTKTSKKIFHICQYFDITERKQRVIILYILNV